jgi:hypothetical protein
MFEIDILELEKLIELLAKTTDLTCDGPGFEMMTELLKKWIKETKDKGESIGERYLNETLYKRIQTEKRQGCEKINLHVHKLNIIAQYLGYSNYNDFVTQLRTPLNEILKECAGTYYCYLRRNTPSAFILRSPVEILLKQGKMSWTLKGPDQLYAGEVDFRNGCLFILMKADNGKQFHHVYEIVQRKKPNVLRGIFSGVSTAFEPIAGRVILIRENIPFAELENRKLDVGQLIESDDLTIKRIGKYFEEYKKNNLGLNKPTSLTFEPDDLD